MATTFKSNQVATNFIKDLAGYQGPRDFIVNADFQSKLYLDENAELLNIDAVLYSTRTSSASVLKSFEKDHAFVDKQKLRLSFLPDYNTFGVISDLANDDRMETPVSANVILNDTTGGSIWAIYALKGNATLSATDVEILGGSGSYSDPMYFKYKDIVSPKITRSGGATDVCCTSVGVYNQTPFIPYFTSQTTEQDLLNVKSSSMSLASSGAIIIRFAEPRRNIFSASVGSTEKPVLSLIKDANNYFAVAKKTIGENLIVRYFINGLEGNYTNLPQLKARNIGITTVGLSWSNGRMTLAANGQVVTLAGLSMGDSFTAQNCTLLSIINGWVDRSSGNALLNMITYGRSLSNKELEVATDF